MNKRIDWIDQVKGFGIFLVVYGHNFPVTEKYIYSFHMPLFFLIAGIFHPAIQNKSTIIKRVKTILVPYFIWSFLLFLFWVFLGRFYGESANLNLSVYKNFIGVFYAQGGQEFMDWGIPLWFLPTIFLTFLLFYFIKKINNKYLEYLVIILLTSVGFLLPYIWNIKFLWSFDVALVSVIFYALGFYLKGVFTSENKPSWLFFIVLGVLHISLFAFNGKIDMYRSVYGNQILFLLNGFVGVLFYLSLFKLIPKFKFFGFLGRFTIPILALQIRTVTVIKLGLIVFLGTKNFEFNEFEKLIMSIFQIIIMIPILFIIKKYIPILNGGSKKI